MPGAVANKLLKNSLWSPWMGDQNQCMFLINFNPTIYLGVFTGLAMLVAMFANLTLLALLLILWKPKSLKTSS
jgi:hypothetical protein